MTAQSVATSPWTDEFLDEMRRTGDPLADVTVEHLFEHHRVEGIGKLLQKLVEYDGIPIEEEDLKPEVCKQLLEYRDVSSRLPDWANTDLIKEGEHLFRDYGMVAFSLLGCASLPELYCCGRGGTQVLILTQRLEQHVRRRIFETSRMIIDVMSEGGLRPACDGQPPGQGIRAAQKVRLMHAAVRRLIMTDPELHGKSEGDRKTLGDVLIEQKDWPEEWAMPIGQEYMGGTLMTFSYVILRGLRTLGIPLSPQQEEAYIHCWNVVGHIMGVDNRFTMNVHNMAEAKQLFDRVMERNRSRTPEEIEPGRQLTRALMEYQTELIESQALLGRFDPFRHVPRLLVLKLLGPEKTELLGVKLDFWDALLLLPFQAAQGIAAVLLRRASKDHQIAHWLFKKMANAMQDMDRGDKRPLFEIPVELADGWGVRRSKRAAVQG
jgi:hypothetical protein